jgi:hypothetical protein
MVAGGTTASWGRYERNLLNEHIDGTEAAGISTRRVMVSCDWDGWAYCGGNGGSRSVSFVPKPFIAT